MPRKCTRRYDEGIQFHFLANPVQVLGDGHVTGVVVQRQRLGDFDNGGRRRPVPAEGDDFTLDVDVLIPAIGQTTDTVVDAAGRHQSQPIQHVRRR